MEVKLLKSDLKDALSETDEKTRMGIFWCYSEHYDDCFHVFQILLYDEKIEEIKHENYSVKRCENKFLIKDCYGGQEIFTKDELLFFIDIWEKVIKVKPNYIKKLENGEYVQVTEEEFYDSK